MFTRSSAPGWAYLTVVLLKFFDWATTVEGLRAGFPEANPLYAWAINTADIGGLFLLMLAMTTALCYLMYRAGRLWPAALGIVTLITLPVVIHNFLLTAN